MREELDELGNENVERSVESVAVQLVVAVLTDLVESGEGSLDRGREWREVALGGLLTSHVVKLGSSMKWHRVGRSSGQLVSSPRMAMVEMSVPAVARMRGEGSPIACRASCLMKLLISAGKLP